MKIDEPEYSSPQVIGMGEDWATELVIFTRVPQQGC